MADSDGDITVKPLVEPPRGLYHAKHRRTRDPTSVGMPDVQIPSPPFEISEPAGLILPKAGAWCARSCPLSDGGHRRGYSLCILLTQASDLGPGFDNNGNPDKGCGKPVSEKPPILLSWLPAKGDRVWLAGSLLPDLTLIKGLRLPRCIITPDHGVDARCCKGREGILSFFVQQQANTGPPPDLKS